MRDIIYKILQYLCSLASCLGQQKKLLILIYHRVLNEPDFMRPSEVDKFKFDWQMQLLSRYFNVLPLADALSKMQSDNLPSRAVCITFDDGYADNYLNAFPILERYHLKATFFIATSFLDGGRMWNDSVIEAIRNLDHSHLDLSEISLEKFDISTREKKATVANQVLLKLKHLPSKERQKFTSYIEALGGELPNDLMMSSLQLQQLHRSGMEIGGHTSTHPIMATLSADSVKAEILDNKRTLEQLLHSKIRYFAYPNGKPHSDYLPEQVQIVQESGFSSAVSTQWGIATKNSDIWQLPRFTPWDNSPLKFMLRMMQMYIKSR